MNNTSYVLVTPARNEESTIEATLESVVRQTVLPQEWIVVSDESTDQTDEVVRKYAASYSFIRLLRLSRRPLRSFASVVFATEAGIAALRTKDYRFLGLLDADIRLGNSYYAQVMARFAEQDDLGLAGGLVVDFVAGVRKHTSQHLREVAGAVQFFRRECFEALGGLTAIPEGGWDAITCVQARMHGFRTQTFPDIEVEHLKPRNIAAGGVPQRFMQLGIRDYALGNHPMFEIGKCAFRCFEQPYVVGGLMRFAGYAACYLRSRERVLSNDIVHHVRREQLARLVPFRETFRCAEEPRKQ